MKFGIIGSGMIAGFHAKAIHAMKGSALCGVAARDAERGKAFAQEYGIKNFASVDALLADPAIDIITVATPSGAHLDQALAAIAAGKHVIIEKPLEVTTERIDSMIAAAEANGVTLAAILNRRFHTGMQAFKEAADAGRFGRLISASAYVKWYRPQSYYDSAAWRGTWALDGGGAVMNQSIHAIDALIHLAGPVHSVQANTACLAHSNIEVEDIAVAILEFKNGARGVIESSTATWSKNGHPLRIQLAGTEGSVFMADEAFELWEFQNETEADEAIRAQLMRGNAVGLGANDPGAIHFYQHQLNFEEVVRAIEEGRKPSTCAREARKSVALIQAIYQSAQNNGAPIFFD
jgi:UDP-N-acetyl-2-amino-2-deoxyglucuronate dehydrogenase